MAEEKADYDIRLAQDGDFEQIYALWLEGISLTFSTMPKPKDLELQFKKNFANRNEQFNFWVAITGNNVTGWISIMPTTFNPIKKNNYGELSIYFSNKQPTLELSKLLLQTVLTEISNTPLQFVLAYVSETNIQAVTFFERHFLKVGALPPPVKEPFYPAKHIYTIAI